MGVPSHRYLGSWSFNMMSWNREKHLGQWVILARIMIWLPFSYHMQNKGAQDLYICIFSVHVAWLLKLQSKQNVIKITENNSVWCNCNLFWRVGRNPYETNMWIKAVKLTLKVQVATIDAQWEGMGDVGSARYEPALLPPWPTLRVLSYSS